MVTNLEFVEQNDILLLGNSTNFSKLYTFEVVSRHCDHFKQTREVDAVLFSFWSTIYDAGPPLKQRGVNVSRLILSYIDL